MPTMILYAKAIEQYLHKEVSIDTLEAELPWIGLDIEDKGDGWIKIEYNPNRPDFSSPNGILRALAGRMNLARGLINYKTTASGLFVDVDPSVGKIRPGIAMAVVRNVKLTDEGIIALMNMQEDIHWAVGRDRNKAAIGLHDFDATRPPYRYLGADPKGHRFEPLQETREMTLQEILDQHPKGIKYKHLLIGKPLYPLIVDSTGGVLSFPPVINGTRTQVTAKTKNFLIDVTGPSKSTINQALNLIVTSFLDDGFPVETLEVRYPDQTDITPDLNPRSMKLDVGYANRMLGLNLTPAQMIQCLERCRFGARADKGNMIMVEVPAYRLDIFHEVDLIEDVAIGYGIDKIPPTMPKTVTVGQPHPSVDFAFLIREILIGLGYQEMITFSLTNREEQLQKTFEEEPPVVLANSLSEEYNVLKTTMLPSLLQVLAINKHNDLPQRIFEVGDTVHLDARQYNKTRRQMTLAATTLHHKAGFSEIKSLLLSLLAELRTPSENIQFAPSRHRRFIEGRSAEILLEGKPIGQLGELHPEVLLAYGLEYPCAFVEINIDHLASEYKTKS